MKDNYSWLDDTFNDSECTGYTCNHETASKHYIVIDEDKQTIISQIEIEKLRARIDERKNVALDNYNGHTFSDSTNYRGKFDKFTENNEKAIVHLTEKLKELEGK